MAFTTPNMGLSVWNLALDLYDHNAQANNLSALDQHDHSTGKGSQVGTGGIQNGAITNAKLGAHSVTWDKFADDHVTALPGSPYDGQIVHFTADATNGVIWTFRYRAASSSPYKWEFVGGPPLFQEVSAQGSLAYNAAANQLTLSGSSTGPTITLPTLPSGGDFDVTITALTFPQVITTGPTSTQMAYYLGSTQPGASLPYAPFATWSVDPAELQANKGSSGSVLGSVHRMQRHTAIPSASVFQACYTTAAVDSGANPWWMNRCMSILPVRVG